MINRLLTLFVLLLVSQVQAAPCCGGAANNPSLLTGDDQFQLTTAFSAVSVVAEAPVGGGIKARSPNDSESSQGMRLDVASLISDRSQLSVNIPWIRRERNRGNNSVSAGGMGDMTVTASYEFLPEWSYDPWKPKGFVFASGIFPTGGSVYDSQELYAIDSRGRGFFGASAGAFFLKTWNQWDTSLLIEVHRYFGREKLTDLGVLNLSPGWGSHQTLAVGWSPSVGAVRLGLAVSRTAEAAVTTSGAVDSQGASMTLWTPMVQVGYLVSSDLSLSVSGSDQTLFQGSHNTALSQSVSFVVQKRWER